MTVSQVPDTSTTLLRDVADSSHTRWSVFYSRYQPMMRSYLQTRFPSLDADDIIQETFVALAKILPDYKYAPKKNGAFHNFLTGVLRNKALCALDASRRQMAIEARMQLALASTGNPNMSNPTGTGVRTSLKSPCSNCCQTNRSMTAPSRRSFARR